MVHSSQENPSNSQLLTLLLRTSFPAPDIENLFRGTSGTRWHNVASGAENGQCQNDSYR